MSVTAQALCGLVLWSVVLTFMLVFTRVGAVMRGEKQLNAFQADGKDLNAFGQRMTRAHANSLENLAGAAALLLLAIATGQTAVTDGLAFAYLGARIAQSVVHIASTAPPAVMLRATFFSVQMILLIVWGVKLLGAA